MTFKQQKQQKQQKHSIQKLMHCFHTTAVSTLDECTAVNLFLCVLLLQKNVSWNCDGGKTSICEWVLFEKSKQDNLDLSFNFCEKKAVETVLSNVHGLLCKATIGNWLKNVDECNVCEEMLLCY